MFKQKEMKIAVFRKAHFNAAHRLHNPDWSEVKNKEVFGLCNNPHYHGHNYELEVKIVGEIDPQTGYLIDLKIVKDLVELHVENAFDHKNLNLECPEFAHLNPTAENIAVVIWQKMRGALPEKYQVQIRLYETPRNYVEYPLEAA